MHIECPFCQARARVPESQEGSKVRCGGCGKVYTARPPGAAARRVSSGPSGLHIGIAIGAVVVLAGLFAIFKGSGPKVAAPVAEAPPPEEAPPGDLTGWDSPPVRAVRTVHEAALAFDEGRLRSLVDLEAAARARAAAQAAEAPEGEAPTAFQELPAEERARLAEELLRGMMQGEGEDAVSRWKPYDGSVVEETDEGAVVHVRVSPREAGETIETRTYRWRLARDGERWKALSWERYFTPEELAARKVRRQKEVTKVTLSDGSILYVAEPRPLEHLADTPPEMREAIDRAYARMIDFSLRGPENSAAREELVAIGKPALPRLLTGLYEIKIEDDTSAAQINLIDQALRDITGQNFGFKPHESLGVSEERRDAAVKAWFAWWLRRGEERFEEKEEARDLLEDLIEPTERDRRQMERDQREGRPPGG